MTSPRCSAVVGLAVTVRVADGWNRLTVLIADVVIGEPLKSASSLQTYVAVLTVGSESDGCTIRVTNMVTLWPGANGSAPVRALASTLVIGPDGAWTTPSTTMLPSTVSDTSSTKTGPAPVLVKVRL